MLLKAKIPKKDLVEITGGRHEINKEFNYLNFI